jgi:hypothetical protein
MAPPAPGSVARPQSVSNAVKLMYAGAALGVVNMILTPMSTDGIRAQIEDAMAGQPNAMTPSQIDGFVTFAVIMSLVFGLIGVGLWLLMAWANGKGKNWARIVATVLFALSAVSFLTSLPQAGSAPLLVAVSGLTTLVGALAIYFLWRKDSSAWFRAQSAPRYAMWTPHGIPALQCGRPTSGSRGTSPPRASRRCRRRGPPSRQACWAARS